MSMAAYWLLWGGVVGGAFAIERAWVWLGKRVWR